MHVHLIGVAGTAMGSLAGLLKRAGHRVTGSDTAFYPPMGEALTRWGIETLQGFDAKHLTPAPDLVVVGNVCRSSNVEARAAIDTGIPYTSLPKALAQFCLDGRRSFVIAGTHGKTTTTALCAHLLEQVGLAPGFLIGGIPLGFSESFRGAAQGAPFVIEGDEYDSAFFEKTPKFWHYQPEVAIIQAIEYDHADIYPDMASYRAAFEEFARRLPAHGVLVANAADAEVRAVAKHAACKVSYYAVDGEDTGDVLPEWLIAPAPVQGGLLPFDLFLGGTSCGRFYSPLFGSYNLKNVVAALALCALATGAELPRLGQALTQFAGVKRRQELRGTADGVRVYDDFAHHPTAVLETLQGFRARHPEGKLIAVFEPRSATASRRIHQDAYAHAFGSADEIILAPVGRSEIPEAERLDLVQLQRDLGAAGKHVFLGESIEALVQRIAAVAQAGDTVVAMSNGAFGQIHDKVLCALACRARRAAE
ncbi:MAG TPA: Mur ligase family protein [Polyangiales bacterium]|nr:Mur ligase family protein [Polyangiales bacterium]